MKSIIRTIITFGLLLATSCLAIAQVGINSDGASPDPSAMLDITSSEKGILIPRMDSLSRQNISNLANGLLVFDTDFNSFWYHTSSAWLNLNAVLSDSDKDTKIQVEENVDEDIIRFDLNGMEVMRLDNGRIETYNTGNSVFIGEDAGQNDNHSDNVNVFIGYQAGQANNSGEQNVFVGAEAGKANTWGDQNVFIGEETGVNNVWGHLNTIIGFKAGHNNTSGYWTTCLGANAGFHNTTGDRNVCIGESAGYSNETSDENTLIGSNAGYKTTGHQNTLIGAEAGYYATGLRNTFLGYGAGFNATGDRNVFLGFYAGYNETGDNKLYISNSNTSNPLIYGEFNNQLLTVNGTLTAKQGVISSNNYVFTVENTANFNTSDNNGMLIKAGHDEFNSAQESSLIRFNTPNGTNLGRIRQDSGNEVKLITSSDRRLKENILPTKYGLADILQIEVKDYNFIVDPDEHVKTGFIAQQLHPIFPTAVAVGDDAKTNPWGVDYAGLTPLLVKGMQDQQQLIDEQSGIIQQQQQQINELQVRVDKITQLEQQNADMKAMLEDIQQRLDHQ
ncbi:MAG: tail fiber domain-containing protein [Bacteroidota bacterium]